MIPFPDIFAQAHSHAAPKSVHVYECHGEQATFLQHLWFRILLMVVGVLLAALSCDSVGCSRHVVDQSHHLRSSFFLLHKGGGKIP